MIHKIIYLHVQYNLLLSTSAPKHSAFDLICTFIFYFFFFFESLICTFKCYTLMFLTCFSLFEFELFFLTSSEE